MGKYCTKHPYLTKKCTCVKKLTDYKYTEQRDCSSYTEKIRKPAQEIYVYCNVMHA